jgi:hypothetical protein
MPSYRRLVLAVLLLLLHNGLNANVGYSVYAVYSRPGRGGMAVPTRNHFPILGRPFSSAWRFTRSSWTTEKSKSQAPTSVSPSVEENEEFVRKISKLSHAILCLVCAGASYVDQYSKRLPTPSASVYVHYLAMFISQHWFDAGILVSDTPETLVPAKRILGASSIFLLVGCIGSWSGRGSGMLLGGWVALYLSAVHTILLVSRSGESIFSKYARDIMATSAWLFAASCTSLWTFNVAYTWPVFAFKAMVGMFCFRKWWRRKEH